jgi:septum formation protein
LKLVLASGSPRRRELLQSIGLDFDVMVSNVEEGAHPDEKPDAYVTRLALEKAVDVATRRPREWVIAADTIVCLDDNILEKPRDRDDAIRILTLIVGREHVVYTGLALLNRSIGYSDSRVTTTRVRMAELTGPDVEWYVDTGEPMDKAGAYAVQGIGAMFIESVQGNYTNVVGLPLSVLFNMMRSAGIDPIGGRKS